ncbi:MAG: hypothetical protein PHD02_01535 [Bacilli bacterium]|nr:hypothetical protein [Bacilli bacterium]
MSVLGSVKNRIKTMFIINKNKKQKKLQEELEEKKKEDQKSSEASKLSNVNNDDKTSQEEEFFEPIKAGKRRIDTTKAKIIAIHYDDEKIEDLFTVAPTVESKADLEKDSDVITQTLKAETLIESDSNIETLFTDKIKNRVDIFVKEVKKEIKALKGELSNQEEVLKKIVDEDQQEEEKKKLEKLKNKIETVRILLERVLLTYDFKYYSEINDRLLYEYVDDFKFFSNSDSVDSLVEDCNASIKRVDTLTDVIIGLSDFEQKMAGKDYKLEELRIFYDNRQGDLAHLENAEATVNRYLDREEEYLINLSKELANMELDSRVHFKMRFDRSYLDNLFRLGIGLSAFELTPMGAFIGAYIIKSSVSGLLRGAFKKEEKTEFFFKFAEQAKKIKDNYYLIESTLMMISSSLNDLSVIKENMRVMYEGYLENPKYKKMYKKLESLEKLLQEKEKKALIVKKKLEEKEEANKVKQKKLEEYNG